MKRKRVWTKKRKKNAKGRVMLRLIVLILAVGLTLPLQVMAQTSPETTLTDRTALQQRLWDSLNLAAMMEIMGDEAVAEAEGMNPGSPGDQGWMAQVAAIHDPQRMTAIMQDALGRLTSDTDPALLAGGLAFYESDLGRRLVGLENSARRAMMEEGAEEDALYRYDAAARRGDNRADQIDRLIEVADLIEPNVAGALNGTIAFSQGFAEGGGYRVPLSEGQILTEAMAQEPQIRRDTEHWIRAYLMLSLSPLSDAEVEDYIAFAASGPGQALSVALFRGYDELFEILMRETGLAAARQLQGRDL